jgi:tryptophan-rich sensory protein
MANEGRGPDIAKVVISLVAAFAAGGIGSIFTTSSIPTWYAGLNKPFFTPPNWLFAPAWTTLYILMAVAAFLVWRKHLDTPGVKAAMIAYLSQLALNTLWSVVFFGLKMPLAGLISILILWLAILVTLVRFYYLSRPAGYLMIPYILWVTFASALNLGVVTLN